MKKGIAMWTFIGIVGIIAIAVYALMPLSASEELGKLMKKNFTVKHTQWKNIDFSTAVKGETPFVLWMNEKPYPALGKYRLRVYGIDEVLFAIGSNYEETDNNLRREPIEVYASKDIETYEKAFIFRSTDGGESFTKTELGHGEIRRIFEFGDLYTYALGNDTYKRQYYISKDRGLTWMQTKITFDPYNLWHIDGDRWLVRIGNKLFYTSDYLETTEPVSEALQNFFERYADHFNAPRVVYMAHKLFFYSEKRKQLVYFDLDDNREKTHDLDIPEGKMIDGIGIETKNGEPAKLYAKLFDNVPHAPGEEYKCRETQQSIWYPFTHEHVQLPKRLPKTVFFDVHENYIGGIMRYKDDVWGTPVHVYTLDRGKNWNYEVLEDYHFNTAGTYIDGTYWFIASKMGGKYLVKGKLD